MRVVWATMCLVSHFVFEADALKVFDCEVHFTKYAEGPKGATGTFSRNDYALLLTNAFRPSIGSKLSREIKVKVLELENGTPSKVKFKITTSTTAKKVMIISKLQDGGFDNTFIRNINAGWASASVPYGKLLGVQLISPTHEVLDIFGFEVRKDYLLYAGAGVIALVLLLVVYYVWKGKDQPEPVVFSRTTNWGEEPSRSSRKTHKSRWHS
eukprot:GEMP01078225.1.p1 GENE.GEMP01078225.1~~GEMP01078225.1.p1  ORF type:complete len:211 (+),score=30.12 GEMP01078225.1:261-893(+)